MDRSRRYGRLLGEAAAANPTRFGSDFPSFQFLSFFVFKNSRRDKDKLFGIGEGFFFPFPPSTPIPILCRIQRDWKKSVSLRCAVSIARAAAATNSPWIDYNRHLLCLGQALAVTAGGSYVLLRVLSSVYLAWVAAMRLARPWDREEETVRTMRLGWSGGYTIDWVGWVFLHACTEKVQSTTRPSLSRSLSLRLSRLFSTCIHTCPSLLVPALRQTRGKTVEIDIHSQLPFSFFLLMHKGKPRSIHP